MPIWSAVGTVFELSQSHRTIASAMVQRLCQLAPCVPQVRNERLPPPLLEPPHCLGSPLPVVKHFRDVRFVSNGTTRRPMDLVNDDAAKRDLMYQQAADAFLASLCDRLEALDTAAKIFESVDFKDGEVLEIHLARGKGTIVLNKHYIHRQIWYSAPNSGADYFTYSSAETPWVSERTGRTLLEQLIIDLEDLTGVKMT